MPPAAVASGVPGVIDWYPMCCAFDIGEIEVQAVEGSEAKSFATRILMIPGNEDDTNLDNDEFGDSTGVTPQKTSRSNNSNNQGLSSESRYDYFSSPSSPTGERSLADSFDSTDEILQNSNEAKLIQRIVEKRANGLSSTVLSGSVASTAPPFSQGGGRAYPQPLGVDYYIQRQDSMSDTNSVNSTDVFVVDSSREMEYLDVLDQHLVDTDPAATEYSQLENDLDDYHPRKHQVRLDDIIDHLCAAPCGECLPTEPSLEMTMGSTNTIVAKPKSVLRKPKWTKSMSNIDFDVAPETGWACTFPSSVTSLSPRVRFKDVDILEFKMTLGNHPSATSGPPVMLDWELFSPRKVLALEQYETTRSPRRKRRQLKLSLQQRHNILVKERGFSFDEVKSAWQEALEIRKQRKETLQRGLALMKWDEVWESTCRKFNRLVDGTI